MHLLQANVRLNVRSLLAVDDSHKVRLWRPTRAHTLDYDRMCVLAVVVPSLTVPLWRSTREYTRVLDRIVATSARPPSRSLEIFDAIDEFIFQSTSINPADPVT